MKIYKLTLPQKEIIQGSHYSSFQFFNCVQDVNDDWVLILSVDDINSIKDGEWSYILELPEGEYVPKPSPIQLPINNPQ
jgi:hypothetical protein